MDVKGSTVEKAFSCHAAASVEQKTGIIGNWRWEGRGGEYYGFVSWKEKLPYPTQSRERHGESVRDFRCLKPLYKAVPDLDQGRRSWQDCFSATCSGSMSREGERGRKQNCAGHFKYVRVWAKGNWEQLNGAECWSGGIAEGRGAACPHLLLQLSSPCFVSLQPFG